MAWPIVKVTSGGIAVTEAANGLGTPYEEAANGFGTPVRFVSSGGIPVVLGSASPLALRQSAQRLTPGAIATAGINYLETIFNRQEAEAEFDAVRIHIHGGESVDSTGWKAVVAATETAAMDTTANRFHPISGGVAYNSVVTSGPGWRNVTGFGTLAAQTLPRYNTISSDWIDLPSVPRADGGLRPLLMLRITHNSAADGTRSAITYTGARLAREQNFDFNRVYEFGNTLTDGIADLTLVPTSLAYRAAFASTWFSVEYRYRVRTKSLLGVGDSITAGVQTALNTSYVDGWVAQAALGVSTPDNPVTYFNGGMGSQTSATFMQEVLDLLNAGLRPTIIMVPSYTVNDGAATTAIIDAHFARIDTLNTLRNSITPKPELWLWKGIPRDYTGANETARLYGHSLCDTYLAQGKCDKVLDIDATISDLASPAKMLPQYAWDVTVHPNQAGGVQMAALLRPQLRSTAFGPTITFRTGIYGYANVGAVLKARPAQVSGSGTISRAYQWYLNGVAIGGATSSTYTVQAGDFAGTITVVETVSSDNGNPSTTSTSAATAAVTAAATNLQSSSNAIDLYTLVGLSALTGGQADPFGGTSAWLATETATTDAHSFTSPNNVTFTNGQTYAYEFYAKRGSTGRYLQLMFPSARFGANAWANFDLSEGLTATVGAAATAVITQVFGLPDWYRCIISAPCTSGGTGLMAGKICSTSNEARNASHAGSTGRAITVAFAQVENAAAAAAKEYVAA